MRKSTLLLAAVAAFLLAFTSLGCNGSSAGNHTISVTLAPTSPQVIDAGQSMLITAAVAFDPSNRGVGWSLQGPGTLENRTTTTVTYQSPASLTESTTVTITASSLANTGAKASINITVNPFVVATTSLPNATVGVPYTARLEVTGGVPPVTWSISAGSLPGWANLDSSTGVISGTPDMAATSDFTVKAVDSASTPASATQALSLIAAAPSTVNNSELKGQYAFLLQGFDDATGNQFAIVGSFIADGNGNITSGLEDLNGPDGYKPAVTFTGKYNVGADNRGYATFTNSLATTTTFAFAVGGLNTSNVATMASMVEFDDTTGTNGRRGTGSVYLQDSTAFNLAGINGPYAFQMVGQIDQVGSRQVVTGVFTADGKGNMTNTDAETVTGPGGNVSHSTLPGTISTTANTSQFGRVMWEVTVPSGTGHAVSYIVNSEHALVMTTDPELTTSLMSGQVMAQSSTAFSNASLSGTSVLYTVGLSGQNFSTATVGLINVTSPGSASVSFDENDNGTSSTGTANLTYAVAANGRVEFVDPDTGDTTVAYLVDQNRGFLVNLNPSAGAGSFEPQTGGPFSNASFSGNYVLGDVVPAVSDSGVSSGVITSSGSGTWSGTINDSHWASLLTVEQVSAEVTISSNGRGTLAGDGVIFYVISAKKAVLMSTTSYSPHITIIQR
jgi:hypothetical protein